MRSQRRWGTVGKVPSDSRNRAVATGSASEAEAALGSGSFWFEVLVDGDRALQRRLERAVEVFEAVGGFRMLL